MTGFKFVKKEGFSLLPETSGVYAFIRRPFDAAQGKLILYIGKAVNIKERVKNHFLQPTFRDNLFLEKVSGIGYIKTDSEIEALILEANLIKKYRPKYNVIWKDDKNYFFVGITKEDFPQIFITHQPKIQTKNYKLKTEYVGPFVDGGALKETLKILRKVFPFRTCKFLPKKSCLWYHINRCPAPCMLKSKILKEIPADSILLKKEAQNNAKNIIKIFRSGKAALLKNLKKEMKEASRAQKFEDAAKLRNRLSSLERIISHAKIFDQSPLGGSNWERPAAILQKIINTKDEINRIEAYDISNIQGKLATGAMVSFVRGKPDKNFYRKFKIRLPEKPNDVAMLGEILSRRFSHPEWPFPDLILIDGGKAQMNAALAVKAKNKNLKGLTVAAIAKQNNELYLETKSKPLLLKSLPREIYNLILQLRDEAHRFAISYHKNLRLKNLLPSLKRKD